MRGDAFIRIEQFFKQSVAKQTELSVLPHIAVRHEQSLPVLRLQSVPQSLWRAQQGGVFIEQGKRISKRAALRLHTLLLYGQCLHAVELLLGLGKAHPTQTIEKIMRIVASRNGLGSVNKGFIGFTFGQSGLRYCLKASLVGR